jgi:Amt family ammonium transporter
MAMVGGVLVAMLVGRKDPGFIHNGPLAGLVAVCAGSDLMHPVGALITGGIAGAIFVYMFEWAQDKIERLDDVLGVWPLHGVCGVWGAIAAGIFGQEAFGGLGGVSLMSQIIGAVAGVVVAFVGGLIVYGIVNAISGLRLTEEEEFNGADVSIHRIGATSLE